MANLKTYELWGSLEENSIIISTLTIRNNKFNLLQFTHLVPCFPLNLAFFFNIGKINKGKIINIPLVTFHLKYKIIKLITKYTKINTRKKSIIGSVRACIRYFGIKMSFISKAFPIFIAISNKIGFLLLRFFGNRAWKKFADFKCSLTPSLIKVPPPLGFFFKIQTIPK